VPLERASGTEVNARAESAVGASHRRAAIFSAGAICEPYVREEEARMMNGL
jgi:hypothetical protein